jgi:hypothetical protein
MVSSGPAHPGICGPGAVVTRGRMIRTHAKLKPGHLPPHLHGPPRPHINVHTLSLLLPTAPFPGPDLGNGQVIRPPARRGPESRAQITSMSSQRHHSPFASNNKRSAEWLSTDHRGDQSAKKEYFFLLTKCAQTTGEHTLAVLYHHVPNLHLSQACLTHVTCDIFRNILLLTFFGTCSMRTAVSLHGRGALVCRCRPAG